MATLVQKRLLNISHLREVFQVLTKYHFTSTRYYQFGLSLGLLEGTLKIIENDHRIDASRCLLECLSAWLRKADDVGDPSWYILIAVLRRLGEHAVADGVHNEKHPACVIFARHQSRSLQDSLPYLVILLHKEGITKELLPATGGTEVLLEAVREAICLNHENLEKFAAILQLFPTTVSVGDAIMKDYNSSDIHVDGDEAQAVAILDNHVLSLSQSLSDPVGIAELLNEEKLQLSDEDVANVKSARRSLCERRTVLLAAVREAVLSNYQCLQTFGIVLCRCTSNVSLGKAILKDYNAAFISGTTEETDDDCDMSSIPLTPGTPHTPASAEVKVLQSMSSYFTSIRMDFGKMFYSVRLTIANNPPPLEELKFFLGDCFPHLNLQLASVESLSDVMELIKENCTLIDIKPLEAVVQQFSITDAQKHIQEYEATLTKFCQEMSLELCLEEKFEAVRTYSLQCETATYVFDWEPEQHKLKDITDILSKSSGRLVQIKFIEKNRSITVTCTFPHSLIGSVVSKSVENLEMLRANGLIELTVGCYTVWTQGEENVLNDVQQESPVDSFETASFEMDNDVTDVIFVSDEEGQQTALEANIQEEIEDEKTVDEALQRELSQQRSNEDKDEPRGANVKIVELTEEKAKLEASLMGSADSEGDEIQRLTQEVADLKRSAKVLRKWNESQLQKIKELDHRLKVDYNNFRFVMADQDEQLAELNQKLKQRNTELETTLYQLRNKKAECNVAEERVQDLEADLVKWKAMAKRAHEQAALLCGGGGDPQRSRREGSRYSPDRSYFLEPERVHVPYSTSAEQRPIPFPRKGNVRPDKPDSGYVDEERRDYGYVGDRKYRDSGRKRDVDYYRPGNRDID